MPATLRTLLEVEAFGLRPLRPLRRDALDRPIAWVHSSDLLDPTPWLEPGQLILTDGAQFAAEVDAAEVDAYCSRLRALDVAGLGFATEVIHARVPDVLLRASERYALPLLEVARRTPFISIIRHVADIEAAERSARLAWSLEAQRAVARAAVRDDGLRGILRTLAQRLGTWVALYDASGGPVSIPELAPIPPAIVEHIEEDVRMLLRKGAPASLRSAPPSSATLQTIGQSTRLRGVLAVGAETPLDPAQNDLVASVIALASIALEQQRALDASRRRLRTGILELAVAGQQREANRTAEAVWGALPEPPLLVGGVAGPLPGQSVLDELELVTASARVEIFFAEWASHVILLLEPGSLAVLEPLVRRHGLRVGLTEQATWSELDAGIRSALHAAAQMREPGFARYEEVVGRGLIGALRGNGGEVVSRTLLSPLDALLPPERRRLLDSASVWLEANTSWDPAARALGIHRHTLRARMTHLGDLLGLDLDDFGGKAELWAALQLADGARPGNGEE